MFIRYNCAHYFVNDLFGNFSEEKRKWYVHILYHLADILNLCTLVNHRVEKVIRSSL